MTVLAPAASLTSAQNGYLIALTAGSLVLCAAFTFARAGSLSLLPTSPGKHPAARPMTLRSRMGQGQWDFSQSFATNIAVIGSVLTLILNSNAPIGAGRTEILPSGAYAGLGIFFGTLVVIAPLLYNGTADRVTVSSPADRDTSAEYHGTVRGFLIAALVTQWGLLGSVATVFMTLLELEHAGSLSPAPVILLAIALLTAMYYFARYSWVKIGGTIADQFDAANTAAERAREMTAEAAALPPPRPPWTLL
jgi:hypothetical protein